MGETAKRVLLGRAVEALGWEQSALRLGSAVSRLKAWVSGAEAIPDRTFLQLLDLLEEQAKRSQKARR